MRADPLCRAAHDRSDEAHDPRQSRSDTSPPISQATARPPIGRCREATRPIFLRETETGTKLSLLNAPTPKPGQNSPCSTHPHPNRDKTLPAQAKRPEFHVFGRAGGILSRKCPNVRALGEFCHGHAPKSARLANFVTDMPRSPRAWRILSRTTLRSRYARHVLSGHQLYARTLTHWLIRPPATPSMGRHHTRGQRGLAAVPVGGGGAWPGFKIDHSEPKARVWRSRERAAAHGRTQQPGRGHGHTQQPGRGHGHTQQPGGCTST